MLLEKLGFSNGIMPIRGQMILFHSPQRLIHRIVNEGNRYLVPRDDGRILAGSTEEEAGYVVETTPASISQLHRWATSILPQLHDVKVERTWAGLRPGSYDSMPYIGQIPVAENLFIAAGHFRSGLHMAPGTARVLADLMTDREPAIDLTPFRVGR